MRGNWVVGGAQGWGRGGVEGKGGEDGVGRAKSKNEQAKKTKLSKDQPSNKSNPPHLPISIRSWANCNSPDHTHLQRKTPHGRNHRSHQMSKQRE